MPGSGPTPAIMLTVNLSACIHEAAERAEETAARELTTLRDTLMQITKFSRGEYDLSARELADKAKVVAHLGVRYQLRCGGLQELMRREMPLSLVEVL